MAFWRVCRVVSQENRLRLLWTLFADGELCVQRLSSGLEMTQPNTTLQLQILLSAGLVRFRREKMNVIYRAEADSRFVCSEQLMAGLRACYDDSVPIRTVMRQATALTHERRIEIARALKKAGCLSYNQLMDRSQMNSSALSRHLHKLQSRGFVVKDQGVYSLAIPPVAFGVLLLNLACRGER